MSKARKRKRRKLFTPTIHASAIPPATPTHPQAAAEAEHSRIRVFSYGPDRLVEDEVLKAEDVRQYVGKSAVIWVHVDGLGDKQAIAKLADIFSLHELAIEDVLHVQQRAKVEQYGDQLYVVLRSVALGQNAPINEQVSIFLGKGFVVSFEEHLGPDTLSVVRERILKPGSHVRYEGADYLLYTIVDSIVDGYFPVAEGIGDALEMLEDEIVDTTDRHTPGRIHELKRAVLSVRRAIWPARDVVNMLSRDDYSEFIGAKTRVYMRDCYDHAMRIIDLIETQREMCSDLMDLYLSSVSNRMNEIIKVLTIVTLVFMPPTLVAGIYGMNFQIPEYKWKYGYAYALLLMGVSALLVGVWAWWRGWLTTTSTGTESSTSGTSAFS